MVLSTTEENESGLVERAKLGDRNAFGELVQLHYQGVVRVVYRLCGDAELAEDMAQEAFLRAWVNLTSFQTSSSLRNWLYRIAINAALDVLRRKKEMMLEDDAAAERMPDPVKGPEAILIDKERGTQIQQAVMSLPEAARSVLVLREYGGLSYQEIASVLNIPVGTVMSRLNYARTQLRELLRPQLLQLEIEYA